MCYNEIRRYTGSKRLNCLKKKKIVIFFRSILLTVSSIQVENVDNIMKSAFHLVDRSIHRRYHRLYTQSYLWHKTCVDVDATDVRVSNVTRRFVHRSDGGSVWCSCHHRTGRQRRTERKNKPGVGHKRRRRDRGSGTAEKSERRREGLQTGIRTDDRILRKNQSSDLT